MTKRKVLFLIYLILTLTVITLLVTGSSLLTIPLDNANTIPLGTFITWAGIVSFPMSIYWGVRELRWPTKRLNHFLAIFLKLIILIAILWVPLSYLLAGNIAFTFSEKASFQGGQSAMKWFWFLSYGVGIAPFMTILVYWISLLFKNKEDWCHEAF